MKNGKSNVALDQTRYGYKEKKSRSKLESCYEKGKCVLEEKEIIV